MRTIIAVPVYKYVEPKFFWSVENMRRVGETAVVSLENTLIYDARNQLAAAAMESKYDRILWLDSDMVFEPDLMERLSADLDEGKDFVTGLYFSRKQPIRPTIFRECYTETTEDGMKIPMCPFYEPYPKDELFEVAACGFGAVMMTVDHLKRVTEAYGHMPFAPVLGFGEDLSYCMRAREAGEHLWCDSRVKLGHIGTFAIWEQNYQIQNIQKQYQEEGQ